MRIRLTERGLEWVWDPGVHPLWIDDILLASGLGLSKFEGS